ncbi:NUDIX hydrolase [Nocardioides sp.]|uniref:NUDIX hydrolase n=1 Tax=Nocardioides sp. TaxID=35761 RepID=UPI0027336E87|nr:NUDIX hydrolase [Nocardioides sp.]MDP3893494.1 NUDIX hydrolase [Nocardioides sp.]
MDIKVKIGVIITDENNEKILLIKEKYERKEEFLWNTIRGTYGDSGDESIFDAAERECLEEASAKVDLLNSLGVYISKERDKVRIQFNFLAKIIDGAPSVPKQKEQALRNESIQELRWFDKKELADLNASDFASSRSYELVEDWMSGKKYPLEAYKQVQL